jgi:hypothetical protein
VPALVTVTVALGTTPPEESLRVPVNAPVAAVWLNIGGVIKIEQSMRTIELTTMPVYRRFEISWDIQNPHYVRFLIELQGLLAFRSSELPQNFSKSS